MVAMIDGFGRTIDYLRISITDRCNLRCIYCVPENLKLSRKEDLLSFDHIIRVARVMSRLGVEKIKLTGGEPTVRKDLVEIVRELKKIEKIKNVTLTTNGTLLSLLAQDLAAAGLDSINVSLDTLNSQRFQEMTILGDLKNILLGLNKVCEANIPSVKVNCVPLISSSNDDLLALASLAKDRHLHVRFIEVMPIGQGKGQQGIATNSLIELFEKNFGKLNPISLAIGNGPARYYSISGFKGKIGFIGAVNSCFCDRCNRLRITSDGLLKTCLHMDKGVALPFDSESEMEKIILKAVKNKPESHLFNEKNDLEKMEQRYMSSIGG
jgi:cyclic pyranopterin phosphate synthase